MFLMDNVKIRKLFLLKSNGSGECVVLIFYCCLRRIILHARFWESSSTYSLLSISVSIIFYALSSLRNCLDVFIRFLYLVIHKSFSKVSFFRYLDFLSILNLFFK